MSLFSYDEGDISRRYDRARGLPAETLHLWLHTLARFVDGPGTIIDAGCGTGRFTLALARHFRARVHGVDPSRKMLAEARAALAAAPEILTVEFHEGTAEGLPLDDSSADLVFLSMVYHHIRDKEKALAEFRRVLAPPGRVAVRTATRERSDTFLWQRFFPEARETEARRTPSAAEIVRTFEAHGFKLAAHEAVGQLFAADAEEYYAKIAMRGMSSLVATPDEAFAEGLARLREHCASNPAGPFTEEIDLFVFAKNG